MVGLLLLAVWPASALKVAAQVEHEVTVALGDVWPTGGWNEGATLEARPGERIRVRLHVTAVGPLDYIPALAVVTPWDPAGSLQLVDPGPFVRAGEVVCETDLVCTQVFPLAPFTEAGLELLRLLERRAQEMWAAYRALGELPPPFPESGDLPPLAPDD